MEQKITTLGVSDQSVAIDILAAAFSDNPAYLWAFPEEAQRREKFHWFMGKVLALSSLNGLCLKSADGRAVALWFEPGQRVGWINLLRAGLHELPFKLGLTTFLRIQKILNQNRKFMDQIMGQADHYYLFHIAAMPEAQGKGIGSSLIRHVTEKADLQNKPCFLETDRSRNIPLYEKHGFQVHDSAELSAGVPLWYMRREPKGG